MEIFHCAICYEKSNINNKFNLSCCDANMCNDCMVCLMDYRCPFCRAIISSIKYDNKYMATMKRNGILATMEHNEMLEVYIATTAPVISNIYYNLFSTNEPSAVQLLREKRRRNIEFNKKRRCRSISPQGKLNKIEIKSYHEKKRNDLNLKIEDEKELYYNDY